MVRSIRLQRRVMTACTYAFLTAVSLFCILPILWLLLTSVKFEQDIITPVVQYLPHRLTLSNYVTLWTFSQYPTLIRNSAIVAVFTVIICVGSGSLGAYGISRYRLPGRNHLILVFLVVRMFPIVLLLFPLFIMLKQIGLVDTGLGLALAYTSFLLPLAIWILKGFFDAIPIELEEAAQIDGCSRLGVMFRIVFPLARSGLIATAIYVGLASWNEFLMALMLTTSDKSRTWPVGLQLMVGEFQLPWGQLSAGGILSIAPIIVGFALAQRSIVRGLTAGGVKG